MTTQETCVERDQANRLIGLLRQEIPGRDVIILDGAMGTMLQSYGLMPGECPELWNLSHPQHVMDIHRAYIRAGADIIETNTFGGNRIKLAGYGLSERAFELNYQGVRLAKEAARGTPVLVAASMGPTGLLMEPFGEMDFDMAYEAFKEQVMAFREAGADLISIETMSALGEAKAAVMAAREATGLPVICHMTFEHGGRTLMGTNALTAVTVLQALGAAAVGANCSTGPAGMVDIIREMAEAATVPISAEPNAGLPEFHDGKTLYHESPEEMARHARMLVEAGACIIGGCCGTTPEHIAAIRRQVSAILGHARKATAGPCRMPHPFSRHTPLRLTGRGRTVTVDDPLNLPVLGDEIDSWRNPEVAGSLKENDMDAISHKAREQVARGANILLVRVDIPGRDDADSMRRVVNAIQQVVDVPLVLVSRSPRAVEAGLKAFWGRAFVHVPGAPGYMTGRDNAGNVDLPGMAGDLEHANVYEEIRSVARRFGALVDPEGAIEAFISEALLREATTGRP